MSCLPKPILRGYAQRRGLRIVVGGVTFGIVCAALYHFTVAVPKVRKYEEFIRTYDVDQHFKELAAAGMLQSVK